MWMRFNIERSSKTEHDFYTSSHDSGRVLWFHVGRPCVCPSLFVVSFPGDNLSANQWDLTKAGKCMSLSS